MSGIIVDIGTGDGTFTYQVAKDNPDRFVIGVDPNQKGLEKTSNRIYKKEQRGGLKNALYVLANVENLPDELTGIANQVFINFPWSGLLKGLVLGEKKTWESICKICQPGAIIDIVLGYDISYEEKKAGVLGLPAISLDYLKTELAPKLINYGFDLVEIREINNDVLKDYPSAWAKKLGYGKPRKFYFLRLDMAVANLHRSGTIQTRE